MKLFRRRDSLLKAAKPYNIYRLDRAIEAAKPPTCEGGSTRVPVQEITLNLAPYNRLLPDEISDCRLAACSLQAGRFPGQVDQLAWVTFPLEGFGAGHFLQNSTNPIGDQKKRNREGHIKLSSIETPVAGVAHRGIGRSPRREEEAIVFGFSSRPFALRSRYPNTFGPLSRR